MDIRKLSTHILVLWIVNIIIWLIAFPIMAIASQSDNLFWICIKMIGVTYAVFISYFNLKAIAEQYEIDRLKHYYKIVSLLCPNPTIIVISVFGLMLIIIAYKYEIYDTIKITTMLFGMLFIILSSRWYLEDIKYIRLPKGDCL